MCEAQPRARLHRVLWGNLLILIRLGRVLRGLMVLGAVGEAVVRLVHQVEIKKAN